MLCSFVQINGSTMLNLSLLTSDMWSVLIRIFAYHEKVCTKHLNFFYFENFIRYELHVEYANISGAIYPFQVDWMYYVAFGAVAVGLVVYSGYVLPHFHFKEHYFMGRVF